MCGTFEEQQGGHVRLTQKKGTIVEGEFRDRILWAILRTLDDISPLSSIEIIVYSHCLHFHGTVASKWVTPLMPLAKPVLSLSKQWPLHTVLPTLVHTVDHM